MAYSSIQLGRLSLAELPQNAAVENVGQGASQPPQRLLRITGQEGTAAALTQASLAALHEDIQGLAAGNYLIPVTFGDKSDRNAFYRVNAAQNTEQGWGSESRTDAWQIDLERIGSQLEIDFESRVTGAATVNNDFSLSSGNQWCSPPAGSIAFSSGGTSSPFTRECSDGPLQTVYQGLPFLVTSYRWGCSVANYGNGRVRFIDENGKERSGLNFSVGNLTGWTMTNGIVRVNPGATGAVLDIAAWTNGAWNIRGWNLAGQGVSLGGWSSVNLLRNDYEMVIVRLVNGQAATWGRATLDLTLRRGSRFVEVYLAADSPQFWSISRQNSSVGVSGTGTLTARDEDSAGNKWTIGSAHTFTADTTNGAISLGSSKSWMDAYIGAVVGGDLLNSNPDFESGISPWGNATGCTFAQSNTRAQNGSFSALMTPDGVTASVHAESEQVPISAGSYQVSGWVWPTASVTGNIGLAVNWYNSSHTLISTTTNTTSATAGQWNFLSSTGNTAPGGAAYATIVPTIGGTPAASNLVWWDQLKLRTIVSALDNAAALLNQYLGRKGEYVQPVRR